MVVQNEISLSYVEWERDGKVPTASALMNYVAS